MRAVMFHLMHSNIFGMREVERFEGIRHACDFHGVPRARDETRPSAWAECGSLEFAPKVGARVAGNSDVPQIVKVRVFQTSLNRKGGEAGPMLDPVEPFLLNGKCETAIHKNGSRGVAVVSVEPQY